MGKGKAEKGSLLPRKEMDPRYLWKLEDLFPDDGAWEAAFSRLKSLLSEMTAFKGKLTDTPENVLQCLEHRDRMHEIQEKLATYAFRRSDEDTARAKYQEMRSRVQALSAEVSKAASFINPELLSLPDGKLLALCDRHQGLEIYRHAFENLLRFKPHTLTPREENILAMAEDMAEGPPTIFTFLNNADIRFPWIRDEKGEKVELTKGRFMRFQASSNREVRRNTFEAFYSVYSNWSNTIAAILSASIKRDAFFSRVRGHASTLEAVLHRDHIPRPVYENFLEVVNSNLAPLHRYIRLKRRVLQLDKVCSFDLFAPILPEEDFNIPYEEGVETIVKGLSTLGEEYGEHFREGIRSGWVDVYENKGKCFGAYCDAVYGSHPFVLLNYDNKPGDMFTLAHEMGHALHAFYTFREQPFVYSHAPIFLAEVASTTNEILLLEHLLATTQEKGKRLHLLNKYAEQIRGTVYVQALYSELEKRMHEKIEREGALTASTLVDICGELYERYFGPDFESSDLFAMHWARIPHFYECFYVYKYATGFSAASALAEKILGGEPGSREKYLAFLGKGSSGYSLELLREAGVDMSRPGPIKKVADKFNSILEEMERLLTD